MTVREHIHALVDEIPESKLAALHQYLHQLRAGGDEFLSALLNVAEDDELETPAEVAAVEAAREDIVAGRVVSHREARRRLLGGV